MSKEIQLPGFRFHPTEEELLDFYLKNMVYGKDQNCNGERILKATGSDRKIISLSEPKRMVGLKKTLVFYTGRNVVLCKIYRKATSLKVLEQRAEMEAKMKQTRPSSLNKEKQREAKRKEPSSSLKLPCGVLPIPELQLPKQGFELGQDQFLSISPWLQNITPIMNLLYF
ncbi:hypothetical protein Bca52824_016440 [Brassica carinata]|uniref:NAC domain-containing protein n=1 Tax=Brassica carinata TaxID=52824 RepID=A0A8X8B6J2_BRACI|nr:hypothetical protein Bca52824_016440 [Brassica carinata]